MSKTNPAALRGLANQVSYERERASLANGSQLIFPYAAMTSATPTANVDVLVLPLFATAAGPVTYPETDNDVIEARAMVITLLDRAVKLAESRKDVSVGCWSACDPAPRWLLAAALGRGMQWGWKARWMVRDVSTIETKALPAGVQIRVLETAPGADVPYVDDTFRTVLAASIGSEECSTIYLGAFDTDTFVGTVCVHLSGKTGGMYNLGVAKSHQRKGVASALVARAVELAKDRGAEEITLNATHEGGALYPSLGFEDVGEGQTFWLTPPLLAGERPTEAQIKLTEAVVNDDISKIAKVDNAMLPCQMTPVRLAAQVGSRNALQQLEERGAKLDVLSAWILGDKDKAFEIVKNSSKEELDAIDPSDKCALLHVAVEKDEPELAKALIAAGASKEVQDANFGSTPRRWCDVLGRPRVAAVLDA